MMRREWLIIVIVVALGFWFAWQATAETAGAIENLEAQWAEADIERERDEFYAD